jgi:tetratricopeptide (TPR) repeat protein
MAKQPTDSDQQSHRPDANTDPDKQLTVVKSLWAKGQHQAAVNSCQELIARCPRHLPTLHLYSLMLKAGGKLEDAVNLLKSICERQDAPAIAFQDLARILMAAGNNSDAQKVMDFAVRRFPEHAPSQRELALALLKCRKPLQAIEVLKKAVILQSQDWSLWHCYALALSEIEKPEEAVKKFNRALALVNQPAEANSPFYNAASPKEIAAVKMAKSDALNQAGHTEESKSCIRELLAADPENAQAWYGLSNLVKFDASSPEIKQMELLASGAVLSAMPPAKQEYLYFALGKAWQDVGDFEKAMSYYDRANRLRRKTFNYDNAVACDHLRKIKKFYPAECFDNLPPLSPDTDEPDILFIVGMPRCGSTLTEQILASHPMAYGAGELIIAPQLKRDLLGEHFPLAIQANIDKSTEQQIRRFGTSYRDELTAYLQQRGAVDRIAGNSIIVDKMLGNFALIGLLLQAIPNARFIHCKRNPVDTCLSCYTLRFSQGHPYSCDQGELGTYYKAYEELMAHWHNVIPEERLLEVSYEDVVRDIEGQVKRIIKFAGLNWTDKVLDFHKTQRAVRTASFNQVTKPIYSSSIERWRPFAPWLGPLLKALEHDGQKSAS